MDPLTLLACHLVGDFILQTNTQAQLKFVNSRVRAQHVTTYTLAFLPAIAVGHLGFFSGVFFLLFIWITHFILDSKRWASGRDWAPKPIMVDQTLHIVVLAIAYHLFT